MKKFLAPFILALLLSACASGVKLNDVPVEDKSGASVSAAPEPVKPAPSTAGNANGVGTAASLRGPYTIAIPSGALAPPGVTLYVSTMHRVAALAMPSGQLTYIAGNDVSLHVDEIFHVR